MLVDENDFFRQATIRICGHLDIEAAMSSCLRYLERFMPADRMYLQLYEHDLGVMHTIAESTASEGKKVDLITPLPQEARAAVERWKPSNPPQVGIINDPESLPVSRAMFLFHGIKEASMLVMVLEGSNLGSLILMGKGKNRYTEEHAHLFSLLREPLAIALSNTLKHREVVKLKDLLADDNRYLHRELLRLSGEEIIGENLGLRSVMEMVRKVAPLDSPVLLLGETGVGKDVIANAIHYSSPRQDGPFITINCGAIPETLLDSELFGHEKGAFTGAVVQKRGRFERADRGTIFLDEIGELPPEAQVRMLRVLENREIERVGGTKMITVDIRIIAATNRKLEEMVRARQFREDLWFRLNVFPIKIPPLRERKEDITALMYHFIDRKSKALKLHPPPKLAPGAIERLKAYPWPGNVRELENVAERALILNKSGPLMFDRLDLRAQEMESSPLAGLQEGPFKIDDVLSNHIRRVLMITKGKVHGTGGAAELLGINPSTLRNRMNKLGIPYGRR